MKTKVEKLTPEQEFALKPFAQRWIDRLDKGAALDKEAATKGAKWLYSFCGLKEPLVIFVASPLGCQLAALLLRGSWANVRENVGTNVWANVWANVEENVGQNVGKKFEVFCAYGSFCQDATWVAFIRFFQEQKVCEIKDKNFESFASLVEANVFDAIQLNGAYIGCEMPIELHRDSSGRLHSTSGMAIKWSDGWGFHCLWGVRFPEELFEKLIS